MADENKQLWLKATLTAYYSKNTKKWGITYDTFAEDGQQLLMLKNERFGSVNEAKECLSEAVANDLNQAMDDYRNFERAQNKPK